MGQAFKILIQILRGGAKQVPKRLPRPVPIPPRGPDTIPLPPRLPLPPPPLPPKPWPQQSPPVASSPVDTVMDEIDKIFIDHHKLAKIKENCKVCPATYPPVGSKCVQIDWNEYITKPKDYHGCPPPFFVGHIHVLLRSQSPPPACEGFWIRSPKNAVCIPAVIGKMALRAAIVARGIAPCPFDTGL